MDTARVMRRRGSQLVFLFATMLFPPSASGEDLQGLPRLAWVDGPTWYAIAGSYKLRREAAAKAARLGDPWSVQNSNICANYTQGLWMVVAGAFTAAEAKTLAAPVGGYAKECL